MKFTTLTTILISALFLPAGITFASAQAKVQENVSSEYHRNSISVISVSRGDSFDEMLLRAANQCIGGFGDKFDKNTIETRVINASARRGMPFPQNDVTAEMAEQQVGKQILSYILCRNDKGLMSDSLIRFRGNYDAKDQDIINARASAVGVAALGDRGYSLVSSSWVVVFDVVKMGQNRRDWSAAVAAYAYKLDITEAGLSDFFEKCWIYEDDDENVVAMKKAAFDVYAVNLVPVTGIISTGSSEDPFTAMLTACSNAITSLEDNIPAWNVATTIYAVHPPRAKIGTKEGVQKGDRYRAYSYKEDASGNLVTVKRGYLRATDIANTSSVSSGSTNLSRFYQISGAANVQEGWTIKQKNDIRLGLILGAKYGGLVSEGGFSFCLGLDYLAYVTKRGSSLYAMFDFATDLTNAPKAGSMNIYYAIGAGFGLHATRFVEFIPYLMFGSDFLSNVSNSSYTGSTTVGARSALIIEPGVKIAVNIYYPLQLILSGCYDAVTLPGQYYTHYNDKINKEYPERRHGSGWGLAAGFKWTF